MYREKPAQLALAYLKPMSTIVDRLVGEMGYTRGTDLRAAPYDFRLSPR